MPLSGKERQALKTRGHTLKAAVNISADNVGEAVITHVRAYLAERELAKVRIHADSRDECESAAAELARQVPCEVVSCVGRVVLFYRSAPSSEAAGR